MTTEDRTRWDEAHLARAAELGEPGPPTHFMSRADLLASAETALEVACGAGRASVWLAEQGLRVTGCDVSPVAIEQASMLAHERGVAERCDFVVADLDDGLPSGPAVDLVLCHLFRDERLYSAFLERVRPGGLLAIAVLSEVGAEPGRFRAAPGELRTAFASHADIGDIDIIDADESDGVAYLLACKLRSF